MRAPDTLASAAMSNFSEWTVLPHEPIEKLSDNLWRVQGTMPGGKVRRQMALARLGDGRVIVHNAIALDEPQMKELEAWGEPAVIFVPNGFHRQDAAIWKARYPNAKVVAPIGSRKRVEKAVAVELVSEEAPHDENVRLLPITGMPMESLLEVRSGADVSLVFCDAVLNMPKLGFPMSAFLGPTGKVSSPRAMRWFALEDKRGFAQQLDQLAATPGLRRVLFGHGKPVDDQPAAALRQVVEQLK